MPFISSFIIFYHQDFTGGSGGLICRVFVRRAQLGLEKMVLQKTYTTKNKRYKYTQCGEIKKQAANTEQADRSVSRGHYRLTTLVAMVRNLWTIRSCLFYGLTLCCIMGKERPHPSLSLIGLVITAHGWTSSNSRQSAPRGEAGYVWLASTWHKHEQACCWVVFHQTRKLRRRLPG